MTALILGVILALGSLGYLLHPLFRGPVEGDSAPGSGGSVPQGAGGDEHGAVVIEEDAIEALREIEFDRATGKLSDSDYARLKARYMGEAVTALRSEAAVEGSAERAAASAANVAAGGGDDAEEMVRRFRGTHGSAQCPSCGVRPEPDAIFCSNCGGALVSSCPACGTPAEKGARFCVQCGGALMPLPAIHA